MNPSALPTVGQTALELGLICSLTVLALFLSYSMLNVCDLSTDGCFTLGAAVGAMVKYPLPAIVVDLGTATKLMVVDENRCFLGGAILAGVGISLRALASDTAQLPHISLDSPVKQVIGTNTIDCMKSGTILGAASMLDGMIQRYWESLGKETTVVACGGIAPAIVPHCRTKVILDDSLVLDGLLDLYRKNAR